MVNIGLPYANGLGAKTHGEERSTWFEKAAADGNRPAVARLALLDAFEAIACAKGERRQSFRIDGNAIKAVMRADRRGILIE